MQRAFIHRLNHLRSSTLDFFANRDQLDAIQYATRQGAVGVLIPIYDSHLLKALDLLTEAIRENTAFVGGG